MSARSVTPSSITIGMSQSISMPSRSSVFSLLPMGPLRRRRRKVRLPVWAVRAGAGGWCAAGVRVGRRTVPPGPASGVGVGEESAHVALGLDHFLHEQVPDVGGDVLEPGGLEGVAAPR